MIRINFSPARGISETTASINGTVLTLNGVDYDLALLEDGATATHPALGVVTRTGDDYELTVKLTHGANAQQETRFPAAVEVTETSWVLEYDYDMD